MMFAKSITWRLTLFYAALSITTLLVMGAITTLSIDQHFAEEDQHEIGVKLALIQNAFDYVKVPADLAALPQKLNDALVGRHDLNDALVGHYDLLVTVYQSDGKILYSTHGANFPAALLKNKPVRYHSASIVLRKWTLNQRQYRGLSVQMLTSNPLAELLNVAIAVDIEHHQIFISHFQQSLWISLITGILIMGTLSWLAVRRGLTPIRDFNVLATRVSANRLNEHIPIETLPKELKALGLSFNDMLMRLEDAFKRLSEFSSDIAHELRTPVSNLMTATHVALSQPRTIEEYREILYSNLEEYDRLSRMISDMLFLAKADNGLIVPHLEPINLADEVDAVIEFLEPLADEKQLTVQRNGTAIIMGDRLMMRRAMSNLLSNAIRHTHNNQYININIEVMESKQIKLTIDNPAEPISQEHLTRIFDRFYRVDPSRQRNSEGSGLGLAITKSIIESHGGKISATSNNGNIQLEIII